MSVSRRPRARFRRYRYMPRWSLLATVVALAAALALLTSAGDSASAQERGNGAPRVTNDRAATTIGTAVFVDVLRNDRDADGTLVPGSVTIVAAPEHGQAEVEPTSGGVTYTPLPDFEGLDQFRYTVEDDAGAISTAATVTVRVRRAPPSKLGPLLRFVTGDEAGATDPPAGPPALRGPATPATAAPAAALDLAEVRARLEAIEELVAADATAAVPTVDVLVETAGSDAELAAAGATVLARIGRAVSARVPVDRLDELAAVGAVSRLEAARLYRFTNDNSTAASGAAQVQQQLSFDGTGVVVGIVDSGIDFFHDDFRNPDGTTRIKALLDITLAGPDLGGGTAYTEAQINAELTTPGSTVPQRDTNGHGTHVLGTAAGDGSAANGSSEPAGTYAGAAPGATLIVVKGGNGGFSDTALTAGLQFVDEQAALLGMPWVTNLSIGGHRGAHDGTNVIEQAIDALVGSGVAGQAVVAAAGNEGNDDIHAEGVTGASGTTALQLSVAAGRGSTFVEIWYEGSDTFRLGWGPPGAGGFPASGNSYPVGYSGTPSVSAPGGLNCANINHIDNDAGNGDKRIAIIFYACNGATQLIPGTWTVELEGAVVVAGTWDAWTWNPTPFTSFVDGGEHVAMPGTAFNAITAAAYTTRGTWVGDDSIVHNLGETLDTLASFSSPGLTRDGRQKPEIAAPGSAVISSASADATWDTGYLVAGQLHGVKQGTSMATPNVVGAVALLLDADPTLDAIELRTALTSTAVADGFTGSTPNSSWGYGKLDAFAAACSVATTEPACDSIPPTDPTPTSTTHTPSVESAATVIGMSWPAVDAPGGATDGESGVDGYSWSFTTGAADVPDQVKEGEETDLTAASATLAVGSWWFHLRTVDNGGNWTSTAHVGPFLIVSVVPCTVVTLAASPSAPTTVGTALTLTPTPTGCTTPQYDYWHQFPDNSWERLAGWVGTNPLTGIDTSGWASGVHRLWIGARGGTSGGAEASQQINHQVNPTPCSGVSLASAPTAPTQAGTAITLTPTPTGCATPQYDYWHQFPDNSWEQLAGWTATDPLTGVDTTGWANGVHRFWVGVRAGTAGPTEASVQVNHELAAAPPPPCTGVTLGVSPAAPTIVGTALTLTPAPTDCATPQYDYWHQFPDNSWEQLAGWVGTNPLTGVDTTGWAAGLHRLWVGVRAGTSGASEASVQVSHQVDPTPCTAVSLGVSPVAPTTTGTALTLTPSPTGCATPQYDYWHQFPDNSWEQLAGWVGTAPLTGVDTTGWATGTHRLWVGARAGTSGGTQASVQVNHEVVPEPPPPCTAVSLAVSPLSPTAAGTALTLTPSPTGCATPQYDYWHRFPDNTWERLAGWVSTNPLTGVDTTGWPVGSHRLWVGARAGTSGPAEASVEVVHDVE